ncbi:transcriptional regulator family: Fungal Specific TF [Paecilomyces variotii]|nr:transcriptional regulator family: Fungal Specific TF [Paecilomyces variotii]
MEKRTTRTAKAIRPAACTECQRRKQKCSREWPCNHCRMRRISHLCRFAPKKTGRVSHAVGDRESPSKTRQDVVEDSAQPTSPGIPAVAGEGDLRVLGYLPDSQSLHVAGMYADTSSTSDDWQDAISAEMESALRTLPPKPYIDMLVQNFLNDANYHYYCLYPPTFSDGYSRWWEVRASGGSVSPEFTCLVLRVCACSLQFLKTEERKRLELELGERVQTISERYHRVARRLSNSIPIGKGGLTQVQQLFLTAFWHKNDAMFIESWHTLAAAIHEAQEIGLHKSSSKVPMTEFEREMRRRVWCLLYSWDWQMSTLLSRPLIINSYCCSIEIPSMRLETSGVDSDLPSPIAHIVLECELGQALCKIPGLAGGTLSPSHADVIQYETEKWFSSLPPAFDIAAPDKRFDKEHPYVALQRHHLHISGYMIMLTPIKWSLTKNLKSASPDERNVQERAVSYSLKLMDALEGLFKCIFPDTPNFHFVVFMIFDAAAFLCSAIIHDKSRALFQRDKVIESIGSAINMMEWLARFTKLASTCNVVLRRLVTKLPLSSHEEKTFRSSSTTDSKSQIKSLQSPPNLSMTSSSGEDAGDPVGEFPYFDIDQMPTPDMADFGDLVNFDFGDLGRIWDWESLDLGL